MSTLSKQPYLLRALYEWCVDAGYTPYIVVHVDGDTRIPAGFARNGEITLNLHPDAVQGLDITDEWLSFTARFGGVAQRIEAPVQNVLAIYAQETGDGMSFAAMNPADEATSGLESDEAPAPVADPAAPPRGKPTLRVVK
jgi:stringent starvation protein B